MDTQNLIINFFIYTQIFFYIIQNFTSFSYLFLSHINTRTALKYPY